MSKVKCPICGEVFNREKVECVHLGNRYYHLHCCSEDDVYRSKIFVLLKEIWGNYTYIKINNQIAKYCKENQYTPKQIYEDLYFFFIVEKGDNGNYKDTIGIVPYIHERAQRYYREQERKHNHKENIAQQINQQKTEEEKVVYVSKQPNRKKVLFELETEEG